MERDFLLPDVGEGLEDAAVVEWHVRVGETVHLNDPLVTIETAKAAVELPSPFEGRVVLLNASEGDELRVGELLARIDTAEVEGAPAPKERHAVPTPAESPAAPHLDREPGPETEPATGPEPVTADRASAGEDSSKRPAVLVGYGVDETKPARRPREWRRAKPPGGRVSREGREARDSLGRTPATTAAPGATAEPPPSGRPLATPPVRWLARTLAVDLRNVRPTGARGEVTREDVRAAAGSLAAPGTSPQGERAREDEPALWSAGTTPTSASSIAAGTLASRGAPARRTEDEGVEELPVRGVRARIAERMSVSRSTIPEATSGLWVDCERLLTLRSVLSDDLRLELGQDERGAESITPFAILAWMVPFALRTAPVLNASFDAEMKVIRVYHAVHLGVATSTEAGLLVPVVHSAHTLGLREFAAELARLTRSARDGTLTPAELTGSTFTVTNYGALGLDDGNPVINAPEAAILGVGTIAPRASVHDGELAVRSTTKLICAFDHRVSDGADAARFLRRLKELIEQPALLLGAH